MFDPDHMLTEQEIDWTMGGKNPVVQHDPKRRG